MTSLPKLTLTEILLRTDVGESFYTPTPDVTVGTYALRCGVKVSTERLFAIHAGKREMIDITRVTVLGRQDIDMPQKKATIAKAIAAVKRVRRTK